MVNTRRVLLVLLCAFLASLGTVAACGGNGGEGGQGAANTGGTGNSTGDGGNLFGGNTTTNVVSIEITPADPLVVVKDGVIPAAITFTAVGKDADGNDVPVNGKWTYERFDIASIDELSGEFTASGFVGGSGKVFFNTDTMTGTTTATVKLHFTSDPQNVDPSIKNQFPAATTPDPTMNLVYPYDKTVFPRGLTGPTLQWNGGNAADDYYIHATSTTFEYEAWGTVPPPSRYNWPTANTDIWRKLTDSTEGNVTLVIQRYDGNEAYVGTTQTWKVAPANLTGIVYYWEINQGNVVRLNVGAGAPTPENFLQKPSGVGCVACHSVSADGSTLVASFHGGYSPWGTFDAATGASTYATDSSSGFQAVSPTGSHVLWRHWSDGSFNSTGQLTLSLSNDQTPLAYLNPGGGAPAHPAWSPDGTKIAFSVRTDGDGLDFNHSTLFTASVDLNTPSFSSITEIVQNDATRPTVTFPTFAPDSYWIAFSRQTQARCRGAQTDIWLTNATGTAQLELDNLNGTPYLQAGQDAMSCEATFLPVVVGGYMWLVFGSERQYGNTLTDANPTTRVKQLWVAAIDASPQAMGDPSHPAFWLPGQELNNQNMRGQWTLAPCKQIGDDCTAGYECCDGFCHVDANGNHICQDQPGPCANTGDACTTAADCCDAQAECIGGFCSAPPPQ